MKPGQVPNRAEARKSLKKNTNAILGICEVLRFIYDEIDDLPDLERKERIIEHLTTAFIMAKKMHNRLVYYKTTYNDTTGHNLANLEHLGGLKARIKKRNQRD